MISLWVGCQSCFQFRYSDKKQLKVLEEVSKDYHIEIGTKKGGGRDIHYTLVSSDTIKPLAIFIHGSPGSSSSFIHFAQDTSLLGMYNVLILDRPGFGYSDFGNAEPSIEEQSSILIGVVKQFPSVKKILIGHSLGGPIIVRMAMDEPSIASSLLIVAGSVSPELEPQEKWRKPMASKGLRWLLPKSFRVSNDEIIPAKQELIKMVPLWRNIICDVQIIQGGKDPLVPAGNEDYAEKMLVNAKSVRVYRLPEQNHFIPFNEPQLLTEALLRFL
jgi:pimeloyl-ACP methyl ester carboxylesterase